MLLSEEDYYDIDAFKDAKEEAWYNRHASNGRWNDGHPEHQWDDDFMMVPWNQSDVDVNWKRE